MKRKISVLPREALTRVKTCDKKRIVRESAEVIVGIEAEDIEGPNVCIVRVTMSNVQVVRK